MSSHLLSVLLCVFPPAATIVVGLSTHRRHSASMTDHYLGGETCTDARMHPLLTEFKFRSHSLVTLCF
ncbi:unnamed protein product [Cuscuta campestris]|uniref:Secreted protein n=1 Tax=Cuscuta campestris TaxID=132261 RepID=A0A484NHF6_9ASTE|nr:unnamed protein product [Cuscuta campestris]